MIDSGATALFVSKRFMQCHHIICSLLPNTIALHNIDGSKNKAGSLTHFARLTLTIDSWNKPTDFLVTDLGPEDIILGLPWLKKVNPTIDWDSGEMEIPNSPEQFTPSPPHLVEPIAWNAELGSKLESSQTPPMKSGSVPATPCLLNLP
jgi:hypothetical protein